MNYEKVEKYMLKSIEESYDLYIFLLYLILKIREEVINKKPKISNIYENKIDTLQKIAYNSVVKILSNYLLQENYEKILWKKQDEYILFQLIKEIKKSKYYEIFIQKFNSSFEEDKNFIIKYYKNFFISNKKLMEYIEDKYPISGSENLYLSHRMVCQTLKSIKLSKNFKLYNNVYQNDENKKFLIDLYRNTISHQEEFNELINDTSKNWDIKRIATIDLIILQMAICEFLYFPNIPPRATMNEYIEIAKIFCMEKSKMFINGILDKVFKLLNRKNKIFKIGKGLI
jgi:N utilization substance protein B